MHAGRTLTGMESTRAKAGGWLANYYLRGAIALVAALLSIPLGMPDGAPVLVAAGVWVALWLAALVREGYAGTDRQP